MSCKACAQRPERQHDRKRKVPAPGPVTNSTGRGDERSKAAVKHALYRKIMLCCLGTSGEKLQDAGLSGVQFYLHRRVTTGSATRLVPGKVPSGTGASSE